MNKYYNNKEYMIIVKDILDNDKFKSLSDYKHHGDNRMNHSIRVSYYSYLLSKKLHLKSVEVARAGLLHDFFFVNNQELDIITRIKVLFTHPYIALDNSKKIFKINTLEENIIKSHMFPIGIVLPKHKESWLVNMVDDYFSIYERLISTFLSIKDFVTNIKKKSND